MIRNYVRLTDKAIFKSRYGQWFFIDTRKRERERFLVGEGSEVILHSLFQGKSIEEASREFRFFSKELYEFLVTLAKKKVIEFLDEPFDSTAKCFNIYPPLDSLNILITNACNLHCAHCYLESGKFTDDELNGKEWIDVLKQAQQIGVFELNISGGEPLLHRDFLEIAEYIASVPTFNANLNTNGTQIKNGYEEHLAKAFSSIQVSIDDIIAENHDAFRGCKGVFKKAVNAIERLIRYGIETNVGFSLRRENFSALDGVVKLCEQLGVTILNIGFVTNIGRAKRENLGEFFDSQFAHHNEFIDRIYQKLLELSERDTKLKILLPFRIYHDQDIYSQEKCYICDGDNTQILYVMANGTIMPCDKLPMNLFGYGNVRKQRLIDVWTSEKMKKFKLMSPRQLHRCKNCDYLQICGGACVARAFQSGGSLESPDRISCIIAQKFVGDRQLQK